MELSKTEVEGLDFECRNFLQSWEMYQRYQALGRESYYVGVKGEDGEILAAGLMLARPWRLGKKIFRVAGGWLMDYEHKNYSGILEFITLKAKEFCRERGGMMLEISPNIVAQPRDMYGQIVEGKDHLGVKRELERIGYKYLGEYEQAKWVFVKDLGKEKPEEMFAEFRTGHRQWVRKAEREGVRVRELSNGELGILKEIAAEAGERRGFRDPEMEYYQSMKEAFGEKVKFMVTEIPEGKLTGEIPEAKAGKNQGNYVPKAEIVTPKKGGKTKYVPLAAAMFVNDGREMVYLYSGALLKWQKYGGAHLLQWAMLNQALETGCKRYNFYGVKPVEGDGVYFFKQGFRGRVEELLGTFVLPIGAIGKLYVSRLKKQEYGEIS